MRWTNSGLPSAKALGFTDLVVPWNGKPSPLLQAARKQGYRIYVEVSLQQARLAAGNAEKNGWAGIIVDIGQSERERVDNALPALRSAYPKLRLLVLEPGGKQPEIKGNLVIKRGSVLEVSSPTAQPWIDTNLALIRIEQRAFPRQAPVYTFTWNASDSGQQQKDLTAEDYSLAVAEAGAFHADLILRVDETLQKALSGGEPAPWKAWNEVRSYAKFYSHSSTATETAANLAVVVDDLDTDDEVLNLLARHNIPFKVLLPADLKVPEIDRFQFLVVFAKPDRETAARLADVATHGKTVVVVDAHGSYSWQKGQPTSLNEHAVSYAVGDGRVLELSEPVSDPETFAQDIRRLLGKQGMLMSLWNALTTIAVPYREARGAVNLVEFVNYSDEPLRVQVRVKGSFASVRYESPEHQCCESLPAINRDGFTEFVIPDLRIAGRVHLHDEQTSPDKATSK